VISFDYFLDKVVPTLMTAAGVACVLLMLALASIAAREAISPSPVVPQPARCCSCGPH
jgi:hypothetical protein